MLFEIFPEWLANLILCAIIAALGGFTFVVAQYILAACDPAKPWWRC